MHTRSHTHTHTDITGLQVPQHPPPPPPTAEYSFSLTVCVCVCCCCSCWSVGEFNVSPNFGLFHLLSSRGSWSASHDVAYHLNSLLVSLDQYGFTTFMLSGRFFSHPKTILGKMRDTKSPTFFRRKYVERNSGEKSARYFPFQMDPLFNE